MYINGHNLCIGCMRPLGPEGGCSFCGMKQEEYTPIPRCLMPGTELAGRYVTGKVLGEGSFGITYMGWDTCMDIPVAVKEYFPCDMVSRDVICGSDNSVYLYESEKKHDYHLYLKKFWGEAKCLSRFNQVEGIVSVRDFFYENETAYLVMQYVDGISVKKHVAEHGKIAASRVLEQIRPVLRALEQVHNTGVVHRDISPDNLMIKEDGSFVLIDFGAARMRNLDTTKTMTVMFKRGFSPEEQYRCKGKWGPYTDVYSICATIYFMMTGVPPVDSVIRALGDEMPSLVSMKELDIPVRQRKALMKGLAVSAKNRWQNIGELYGALFGEEDGTGYRRSGLCMPGGGRWGDRKKAVAAVFCVFLFAGFAAGSIYLLRHNAGAEKANHLLVRQTETLASGAAAQEGTAGGGDGQIPEANLSDNGSASEVTASGNGEMPEAAVAESGQAEAAYREPEKKKVKVPDLAGMKEREAKNRLGKRGLKYKVRRVEHSEKKGTVVAQSVRAGKQVAEGTKVTLTVSSGTAPVRTPAPGAAENDRGTRNEKKPSANRGKDEEFAGVIQ